VIKPAKLAYPGNITAYPGNITAHTCSITAYSRNRYVPAQTRRVQAQNLKGNLHKWAESRSMTANISQEIGLRRRR
jgi:hypothetical protein